MAEVRDIVRGLKARHRLIFMSSHILQEVTDICDEVALIDQGKLLFYDTLPNVRREVPARSVLDRRELRPADSARGRREPAGRPARRHVASSGSTRSASGSTSAGAFRRRRTS